MIVRVNGVSIRYAIKTLASEARKLRASFKRGDVNYDVVFQAESGLAELQEIQAAYNTRVCDSHGLNLSRHIKMIGVLSRAHADTGNEFYRTECRNSSHKVKTLNETVALVPVENTVAAMLVECDGDNEPSITINSTGF